jgi:hypothetical protein
MHSLLDFTRSRQHEFRLSVAHGHTQICSGNFGQTRLDWAEDITIDELHMIFVATSRHRMTTRRVGSVFPGPRSSRCYCMRNSRCKCWLLVATTS